MTGRRGWRVTVRHSSEVTREKVGSLDEALDLVRDAVDRTLREGGLKAISALRDFEPDQRVHTRIEVTAPGMLRGAEAGLDVMGDRSLVAYRGVIRKIPLEADTLDEAIERIREELS